MAQGRRWQRGAGMVATCALLAGCSASPREMTLTGMHESVARGIAMDCWRANEGLRLVHGDHIIWSACLHWARDRTRGGRPTQL